MRRVTQVRTRDGAVVPFDLRRVADAIYRAARSVGGEDRFLAEELAGVVGLYLERSHGGRVPSVVDVEDAVERVLVDTGHAKTAKAYIVSRDRRRTAREAIEVEEDERGERPLPLVGSDAKGAIAAWSTARVKAALVEEAGLDASAADEVARAVEGRVISSGLPRVSSSLVRSLVDAELFERGHVRTRERQRVVGLPKSDLVARMEGGLLDRRALDPSAFAEALGEDMLRQLSLEELVPAAAAEAHRLGNLHLTDLGTPFSMPAVAPAMGTLLERHLRGEDVPRAGGARRFASALGEIVARLSRTASRRFVLEDVNVHWAPFVDRLDEDGLRLEARELLLSPAVQAFPRRGGLLRLELVLAAAIPARWETRPAPPPAAPGRVYGDFDDAALRAARALLAAASELRREGVGDRLPDLTLVVPRRKTRDPAERALLEDALGLAAEGGEPVLLIEPEGLPGRGGRDLRAVPSDFADPFRLDHGDVSLASVTGLNLVGPALAAGPSRVPAYHAEIERLVTLAVEAAASRAARLGKGAERPDGSLWTSKRGLLPLLDPQSGVHRIEAVGADRAVACLFPDGSVVTREAHRRDLILRVRRRAEEEARARDLFVSVVERGGSESASRFAEGDATRFESARAWWKSDESPCYRGVEVLGPGLEREPAGTRTERDAYPWLRTRQRVETDRRPAPEALREAFESAVREARVVEHTVEPWPRRTVNAR